MDNSNNKAIESLYKDNLINEELVIYKGHFCIYSDIPIKCDGIIYYKINEPVSINFKAKIYKYEEVEAELEDISLDNVTLEIPGYKLINAVIYKLRSGKISGYVDDIVIKSKDNLVDYLQFDIVNMDKIPGKLVKYKDLVYAGRVEFGLNDYTIIIDKNYNYNKETHRQLVSRTGSVVTHTGRIYRKDGQKFRTKNMEEVITNLSLSLSFCCGRYINIPNAMGYSEEKNVYRAWYKRVSSDYRFVFKWTTTISNYHNFEKYLSLSCKALEDRYFNSTLENILDWYIEALNGINLGNNIISIQTALEMLSYVVLVENSSCMSVKQYDARSASQNIRTLLKKCKIDYSTIHGDIFSEEINLYFSDGVDLITYYRNCVVHPSKQKRNISLQFDEMYNIILLGIKYIELVLLYIMRYRGEYTDRFKEVSFGDVELVPWVVKNKK